LDKRDAYKGLVGKFEGKRPLGRSRRGWEDDIKIGLKEVGLKCVDRIDVPQDRDKWRTFENAVMKLWFP
jgi:hypothetical protein